MSRVLHTVLAVAMTVSLSACATPGLKENAQRRDEIKVEATTARDSQQSLFKEPYFVQHDEIWVGSGMISTARQAHLPDVFKAVVIYRRQYPSTLNDVAEYVTSNYGVAMSVSEDANKNAGEVKYDAVAELRRRNGEQVGQDAGGLGNNGVTTNARPTFVIQYEGDLRGFLDKVAAQTGNSWDFRDGSIRLFNLDTRVFTIKILPGTSNMNAQVTNSNTGGGGGAAGGGGEGGGGGGNSNNTSSSNSTSVDTKLDSLGNATDAIKSMLSSKGRLVTISGMNQVSVTDTPAILDRIQTYIGQLNKSATQQVVLDVKVYNVELSNEENYGISWAAVWSTLGTGVKATINSPANADAASGNSLGLTVIDPSSPFQGSNLVLNALSKQGNLSVVTTATVTTLSGRPVPVQMAEETGYLANSQTTLVPNAGSETSLTAGKVTTGFSMQMLPIVTGADEVLLQLAINLSSLREIRRLSAGVGSNSIESPIVDSRQILQFVKIISGQTLVLSGFEQDNLRSDASGVGSPKFALLGGGKSGTRRRTTLVVLVTPRVVE